jgi:sigma-B regulation protein RsbU (phosphoserine phosphatase)
VFGVESFECMSKGVIVQGTPRQVSRHHPDILVVDDDPVTIASIGDLLVGSGYTVASAPTGEAALNAVPSLRPRMLILDVGMPGMDGYTLCRRMREHPATSNVPILFLSSASSVDARVAGLRAGGIDFLGKPCADAELLARVDAHLEVASRSEELARLNHQLSGANNALQGGLRAASRVQSAMLSATNPGDASARFAWRCIPCEQLGGDLVNVLRLSEGLHAVYVLDASGHGLPAALLAVAAGYFLSAFSGAQAGRARSEARSPAAVIGEFNRVLNTMAPPGAFVTVLAGVLDAQRGTFTFASAGHPGPLRLRPGMDPEYVDRAGIPAGLGEDAYDDHVLTLQRGERLLLYSDGVYEQANPVGERFGRDRLLNEASARQRDGGEALLEHLVRTVEEWRGSRPTEDDLSLLAIDYMRA